MENLQARETASGAPASTQGASSEVQSAARARMLVIAVWLLVALTGLVMVRCAWLGDDALITFRQVVNFFHGYGLSWNPGERVQAFTHPIWFLLTCAVYLVTRELYVSVIAVSVALSTAALAAIVLHSRRVGKISAALLPLGLLLYSKAFIDYSTSGLENPLSYLLTGTLLYVLLEDDLTRVKRYVVAVAASLLLLCRLDYAIILAPLLPYFLWRNQRREWLGPAAAAGGILFAWHAFATFYFGSPLPNTYFAKLGADFDRIAFLISGIHYFLVQLRFDPVTLITIATGLFVGVRRGGAALWLCMGMLAYLAYVTWIGGDFMMGRFFTVPAYIGAFLTADALARGAPHRRFVPAVAFGAATAIVLQGTRVPVVSGSNYGIETNEGGVTDERGHYYARYGLLARNRKWPEISVPRTSTPADYDVYCGFIGEAGLQSSGSDYIIDSCALTDSFISRLPAVRALFWRIGHFHRKIPTNYGESVLNAKALLDDQRLRPLFEDVERVRRGPLFDSERLGAVVRLAVTKPYRFSRKRYADPEPGLPLSTLEKVVPYDIVRKQPWEGFLATGDFRNVTFGSAGLRIKLERARSVRRVRVTLGCSRRYELELLHAGATKTVLKAEAKENIFMLVRGLVAYDFELKPEVIFDEVLVRGFGEEEGFAVGHLRFE